MEKSNKKTEFINNLNEDCPYYESCLKEKDIEIQSWINRYNDLLTYLTKNSFYSSLEIGANHKEGKPKLTPVK